MATVELDKMNKVYENGFHAVQDLSIDVDDGEFLVMVGPSGCGKSTALRMVAGLEDISTGELRIGGRRVNDVDPQGRDIAMVFQSYALYPHMSVADNMAYGLKLRQMPKDQINARVNKAAEMLELTRLLDRKPKQLSGGQRQRVAMGRSIVREPQVFLMDEPLSNLDAKLRVQMRAEISAVVQPPEHHDDLRHARPDRGHDDGRPDGRPQGRPPAAARHAAATATTRPTTSSSPQFVGSPPMNLVTAKINQAGDGLELEFGGSTLPIPASVSPSGPRCSSYAGRTVALGVRSEDMEDATLRPGAPGTRSRARSTSPRRWARRSSCTSPSPARPSSPRTPSWWPRTTPRTSCTSSPTRACAGWRPSRRARACGWATTSRSSSTSSACTTSTPRPAQAIRDLTATGDEGPVVPRPWDPHHDGSPLYRPEPPVLGRRIPVRVRVPHVPQEPVVDHVVLRSVRDGEPVFVEAERESADDAGAWWVADLDVHNPADVVPLPARRGPVAPALAQRLGRAPARRHRRPRLPGQHRAPDAARLGRATRSATRSSPTGSSAPRPAAGRPDWATPADWDDPVVHRGPDDEHPALRRHARRHRASGSTT